MFKFINLFNKSKKNSKLNDSSVKSRYFVDIMKKNHIVLSNKRYLESLTKHSAGITYKNIGKSMNVGSERARQMDKKAQQMIENQLKNKG